MLTTDHSTLIKKQPMQPSPLSLNKFFISVIEKKNLDSVNV